ncbi:acetolactate synthase III large subunit [Synechococcus sp. WH 7805]|nr:acetolactate synthase III large subunit [Synechococcus sp. WH 7805]
MVATGRLNAGQESRLNLNVDEQYVVMPL